MITDQRPTIDELEAILADKTPKEIQIQPDGSITAIDLDCKILAVPAKPIEVEMTVREVEDWIVALKQRINSMEYTIRRLEAQIVAKKP
jgi:YbbR domain-containing protein